MRIPRNVVGIIFGLVIVSVVLGSPVMANAEDCAGSANEGWDAGSANGWIGATGTTITVMNSGGNPDGYLKGEKSGPVMIQTETPPFTGNYVTGGIREISVDIQLFSGDNVSGPLFRIRQDAYSNGWYYDFSGTLTIDGQWHHYVAPVNPYWDDQQAQDAGWIPMDNPVVVSFADTLAGVGYLIFWVDAINTPEVAGFDNATIACPLFFDGFENGDTGGWSSGK